MMILNYEKFLEKISENPFYILGSKSTENGMKKKLKKFKK